MSIKTIAQIGAILLILAVAIGLGWKLVQRTNNESQRADEIQNFNYVFEPHFGIAGCARYIAPERMIAKKEVANVTANSTK
jgi:hypothetical protein